MTSQHGSYHVPKTRSIWQKQCYCIVFRRLVAFFVANATLWKPPLSFCDLYCQGSIKYWHRANCIAGVGNRESAILRGAQHLVQIRCVQNVIFLARAIFRKLCAPHFTLCTPHYTLDSQVHALHFYSTLYALLSTLHNLHFTLNWHSTLYTLHFALHTLHYTLDTAHSTLYTWHCTLHTLRFTLYTLHLTAHTRHSALYTWHSRLYTFHFTLRTWLLPLRTLHFTLDTPVTLSHSHTLHFTLLQALHYTLYTWQPTLFTLHFALNNLHFTLHTVHCTPYAVRSHTLHCTVHSTVYSLHWTLSHFTPCLTLYFSHWPLGTPHATLYTLHSTLCLSTLHLTRSVLIAQSCSAEGTKWAAATVATSMNHSLWSFPLFVFRHLYLYHWHACGHSGSWAASCVLAGNRWVASTSRVLRKISRDSVHAWSCAWTRCFAVSGWCGPHFICTFSAEDKGFVWEALADSLRRGAQGLGLEVRPGGLSDSAPEGVGGVLLH